MTNNLDDLAKRLKTLSDNAKAINGENEVPFNELFSQSFMLQHTNNSYSSFDGFLKASGFADIAFEKIPNDEWDKWVANASNFGSWDEMKKSASQAWITKKLGF